MAKSKRVSVLLTDESERRIRELSACQSAPTPLAALCQVALELGLQKMCNESRRIADSEAPVRRTK
jgi:hypothetical protein